ncbi:hypothetical protein ABIA39_008576 [Nocardia sp. GAS34]|uniref:hypothetical protein n=1 Tax=unclassified Nocardia TaxID=2637762 RepID=UPI003D24FD8F
MASVVAALETQDVLPPETCLEGGKVMDEIAAVVVEDYESPGVETKLIISRQCN